MRQIQIFKFDELSEKAKEKAIEERKEWMEDNLSAEAENWAIDDCALFEPSHKEMVELLGEDYYDRNTTPDGKYGQFVFKNTRKWIMTDRESQLNIASALEITNDTMFKLWLGVPEILHKNFEYEFIEATEFTKIRFKINGLCDNPMEDVLADLLDNAQDKFNDHMQSILDRISTSYDEYFSDDNVIENIEYSEIEFFEDGEIYEK